MGKEVNCETLQQDLNRVTSRQLSIVILKKKIKKKKERKEKKRKEKKKVGQSPRGKIDILPLTPLQGS